jgi:PQQ-like domain
MAAGATTGTPASGSGTGASGPGSTGGSGAIGQDTGASAGASGIASGASAGSGATASGSSPASGQSSGASPGASVVTQHNDLSRTGLNPNESILTPTTVDMAHFGKTFSQPVDGWVYAQPLVVPQVAIPGMGAHDVVYVATENNSVYAFDAATKQAPLWHVSFNSPGITPVPAADTNEGLIVPQIGITGTPAIDVASGTLYVVAETKITAGPSYAYHLHALDLATGAEKLGGPVVLSGGVPGMAGDAVDGMVSLSPLHGGQKAGLALSGGILYVPLAGHGDRWKYWHGWIFGYDAATLTQKFVWCSTPDANAGAIWQSAAGIPIDSAGNAFAETGNGTFDAMGGGRDLGESLVKVSATGTLVDWFAPHDAVALANADADLGSAGPILLPDQTGMHPHLAIATGKPGYLYVVDRDQMGHFNAAGDTQIVQKISVGSSVFSTPVYFNGRLYVSPNGQSINAFSVAAGQLSASPVSQSARTFGMAFLAASSNGTTGGIVWALQGATLYAYDASDLTKELYDSTQAPGNRDAPGPAGKFVVPTVANGRVYVATQSELDVYGAL